MVDLSGDNVTETLVLDGFVIEGGAANGGAAPVIGGGVRVRNGARPTISNCRIVGNIGASGAGLGIDGAGSKATLVNCLFVGNEADVDGGAILIRNSDLTSSIINCTIASNTALAGGGVALADSGASATFTNSILVLNKDDLGLSAKSQIGVDSGASVSLSHCVLPCDGDAVFGGVGLAFLQPRFSDLDGDDNLLGTSDDNGDLAPGSPCIDAGTLVGFPADVSDLDDDGDVAEFLPLDVECTERLVADESVPDVVSAIDIGCDEADFEGEGETLFADLNGDNIVDGADLALVLGSFLNENPDVDLTGDCIVDGADLGIVLGSWTN
ncbi:MAG: right-handed parallel beta-helix repeat-containing protein [Phycisphaerae bacterium]|nr:right-handed parallel beta-helix repeat-containing protein [Phycisphaerae bacterium]